MDPITSNDSIADQPEPAVVMALANVCCDKALKVQGAVDLISRVKSANDPAGMLSTFAKLLKLQTQEEALQSLSELLPICGESNVNDDLTDDRHLQKAKDLVKHLILQSIEYFKKYIELVPEDLHAYHMLIYLHTIGKDPHNGITYAEMALKLDPNNAQTYSVIGDLYYYNLDSDDEELSYHGKAEEYYKRYQQLNPEDGSLLDRLGHLYYYGSRMDEAAACYRNISWANPRSAAGLQNTLFYSLKLENFTQADIYKQATQGVSSYIQANEIKPMIHVPDPEAIHKKLHIGYLSGDFRYHVVMYFIEPVLQNYNKEEFTVSCYSNVGEPDYKTLECKSYVDRFIDIHEIESDKALAELIRGDDVDILVDLAGHTGASRVLAMAYKPAPIQVTYQGYPSTTGMTAIDYILTDRTTILPAEAELYSEQPFYLDFAYETFNIVDENLTPVTPLPALENGYITFGFFNCLSKVNPGLIETFAGVLHAVPGAKLLMHRQKMPGSYRERILDHFGQLGIPPERLILSGEESGHIQFMNQADIALDPFPYNGTTTTIECILQGLPVICLYGDGAHQRSSARINLATGLPQLVAQSVCQYIRIAEELSGDIESLSLLRQNLRQALKDSRIADHKGFVHCLEEAYRTMWRSWCCRQHHAELCAA